MLTSDLRSLLIKYRIPQSFLRKEVLVDEEFLEDFAKFGNVVFPHAFPGFIFRYVGGVGLDEEPMRSALRSEYPHIDVSDLPPERFPGGENLFVEAPPERIRDLVISAALKGFEQIFGVARESVVIDISAEPGWKEYSHFSAFLQTFYKIVDAYRLPSDAFYPHPKGSMAGFILKKKKSYDDLLGYFSFLKRVFSAKRKKLKNLGVDDDRRAVDLSPDEFLELYETTG